MSGIPKLYRVALAKSSAIVDFMADRDANEEALEQVEESTDSKPVKGEELLESDDLKRQLREAKERLGSEP